MDYRETCRCGSKMEASDLTSDEARYMANVWRKHHSCLGSRVDHETGEVTGEVIEQWMEAK